MEKERERKDLKQEDDFLEDVLETRRCGDLSLTEGILSLSSSWDSFAASCILNDDNYWKLRFVLSSNSDNFLHASRYPYYESVC